MRQRLLNCGSVFVLAVLVACGGGGRPAPPPPCPDGLACTRLGFFDDPTCRAVLPTAPVRLSWIVSNKHPSRAIRATLERTSKSPGQAPIVTYYMTGVLDPSGKGENLGCQDPIAPADNHVTYRPIAGCFADECGTSVPTTPTSISPTPLDCEAACANPTSSG